MKKSLFLTAIALAVSLFGFMGCVRTLDPVHPSAEPPAMTPTATPTSVYIPSGTLPVFPGSQPSSDATYCQGVSVFAPMFQFQLTNPTDTAVTITGINFTASGTGNDAPSFLNVMLYLDANENGVHDAADTILTGGTFSADDGTFNASFSDVIPPLGAHTYLLCYVFWYDDEIGTYQASIASSGDITAPGAVFSGLPLHGRVVTIVPCSQTPTAVVTATDTPVPTSTATLPPYTATPLHTSTPTPAATFTQTPPPATPTSTAASTSTAMTTSTAVPTATATSVPGDIYWHDSMVLGASSSVSVNLKLTVNGSPETTAGVTFTGPGGMSIPLTYISTISGYAYYVGVQTGMALVEGQDYTLTTTTSAGIASATITCPGQPVISADGMQVSWSPEGNADRVLVYQNFPPYGDTYDSTLYTSDIHSVFSVPTSAYPYTGGNYYVTAETKSTTDSISGANPLSQFSIGFWKQAVVAK